MLKRNFKSKFYFLLPYILVFFIPFFCLSLLLHHYFIVNTQEQLEQYEKNSILKTENNIYDTIISLNQMTNNISNHPKLTRYYVTNRAVLNETSELLKQYANINSNIDEMILYYPLGDEYYYSSQGFYDSDAIMNQKLRIDQDSFAEFNHLLNSDAYGLFLIKKVNTPQLVFISNLKTSNYKSGKVIYFINSPRFVKHFSSEYEHDIVLLNHKNDFLYSSKDITEETLQLAKQHQANENYKTLTAEKDYIISYDTIGVPFKIVTLINKNKFKAPLNRLKFLFYFGIVALSSVGLWISWFFTNRQYRPVKNIADSLRTILPNEVNVHADDTNIYRHLQSNIDLMIENQNELSLQLERQKNQYINSLYKSVLEGNTLNETDQQFMMTNLKTFDQSKYFTIIINSNELMEQLDDIFPFETENFEAFLVNERFIKQYQLIFCHYDAKYINPTVISETINHYMLQEELENFSLLVGRSGYQIQDFYSSYLDTLYLLEKDSTKFGETESILFFNISDQTEETDANYIFSTNFIKLRNSIENGNSSTCQTSVEEIIEIAKNPTTNQIMSKTLLYEIVNCLMKYATEHQIKIPQSIYDQLGANFNPYNAKQPLLDFANYICEQMQAILEKKEQDQNNEIITHILAHYRNIDFSIEQLADDLDVSVNAINQVLKEKVGITFSKYVQQLRFNYVKEQLVSTELTIKDIIRNSGYLDASNFTRQFRTFFGCTPGQYRTQYKNKV